MKNLILISFLIFSLNLLASESSGTHLGGVQGGGDESDRIKYESGQGYEVKKPESKTQETKKESSKESKTSK